MRTIIVNGTVVTADQTVRADVLIEGEKVVAMGPPGSHSRVDGTSEVIDAAGKYVVPGGVDVHTHFEMPFERTVVSDSFETGTRAAAFGGTTTIVDFAEQAKGESVGKAFEEWIAKAEGNCAIDFSCHMIVSDVNDASLREMSAMIEEGVTSFKLFMAYPGVSYSDDGELLRAMQQAARDGTTIMMHAENGIAIDVLREQAVLRGDTDPKYHSITRPPSTESEAVHRAITLAQLAGVPLYIVHVSAKEAAAELANARERGLNVFGETCPHYLHLSVEDHVALPGFEGAKYVCSPPIRFAAEGHQDYLWTALARGDLQVVATDHASFFFDDDAELGRQKRLGEGDFTLIPNGLPGVEERFNVMYQSGVVGGRFDINRWVDLIATSPAKMFGLFPRKGTIAVGSDADIVIYDPGASFVFSAPGTIHGNIDYTCYEGMKIDAKIDTVLSRGKVIVDDGRYLGSKADGSFLRRAMSML